MSVYYISGIYDQTALIDKHSCTCVFQQPTHVAGSISYALKRMNRKPFSWFCYNIFLTRIVVICR